MVNGALPRCSNHRTMRVAPNSFSTARLDLRRIGPDDFEALYALDGDARVMASITGHALSKAETQARILVHTRHWEEHGYGLYVARLDGAVAGQIMLLRRPLMERLDAIELGYAFRPQLWGVGLATEAADGLLSIAFQTLDEPEAVAITGPQNAASRRVMEKNGLSYRCEFRFREQDSVLYGITQAQWQSRSASPQV